MRSLLPATFIATLACMLVAGLVATVDDEWAPMPYPGDRFPAWHPTGDRVLFASNRGPERRWTLYELALNTGHIQPVLPWGLGGEGGHYAPEGKRVVFQLGARVGVHDRETETVRNLSSSTDPGDVGFDARFRDQNQIVFWRKPRRHPHNALFRVTIDEDLARQDLEVLVKGDYDIRVPRPSPTGDRIAYAEVVDSASGSFRGGRSNICVWDLQLGERKVVFVSPYALEVLEWFPDGDRLLVWARGGTEAVPMIYTLDLETRRPVALHLPPAQRPAILPEVAISPDGQWYCYPASSSEGYGVTLWRCRIDGSDAEELTHSPQWYYDHFPDPEPIFECDTYYGDPDYDPLKAGHGNGQ